MDPSYGFARGGLVDDGFVYFHNDYAVPPRDREEPIDRAGKRVYGVKRWQAHQRSTSYVDSDGDT